MIYCCSVRNMLLRLIYISISALLLFFLNTNLYAQVEAIDSIDSQLGKGRSQEERINIRNRLAAEYMKTDRERALDLIEQVISEAENSNLRVELALAYRYKGEIHNGIGKYTDAIKSYMEAIAIYNSLDMLYEMGYCYYSVYSGLIDPLFRVIDPPAGGNNPEGRSL